MDTIDGVIIRAVDECKMAPILSMIIIGGFALLILVASLVFLIPLSRKMSTTANHMLQFDVYVDDLDWITDR